MPLLVYRILKIIVALGIVGIFRKRLNRPAIFLILTSLILALVVFANDAVIFGQRGNGFGVQGRYFLPGIAAHMILLVFGWFRLIPAKWQAKLGLMLICLSLGLNFVGLSSACQYFGWIW